ncbi:MAG TPA: hypothetical protein VGB79_11025 [Allosphingosinicella sp.]|jgi:hypothetical protein
MTETGPFYIKADCCTQCGVPHEEAPKLFGWGDDGCVLLRQPEGETETDGMIGAIWASEMNCIRYAGRDEAILKRLGEAGLADYADDPGARRFRRFSRNRVRFSAAPELGPAELAASFRAHLAAMERMTVAADKGAERVRFAWWEDQFHEVRFEDRMQRERRAMLVPCDTLALQGVARIVDTWLKCDPRFTGISWHSRWSMWRGKAGRPRPL